MNLINDILLLLRYYYCHGHVLKMFDILTKIRVIYQLSVEIVGRILKSQMRQKQVI